MYYKNQRSPVMEAALTEPSLRIPGGGFNNPLELNYAHQTNLPNSCHDATSWLSVARVQT